MNVFLTIWNGIVYFIVAFFNLFLYWLSLFFVIPFRDFEILWILIPIWLNLIFSDFYQEKKGTDLGNAVTNGAAMLWVGIDWTRYLVRSISTKHLAFSLVLFFEFFLCLFVFLVGLIIILEGVKGKHIVRIIGRVRQTSYLMLVLSPIIYGIEKLSIKYLIAALLFFPLFYYVFEFIDRSLPDPKSINDRQKDKEQQRQKVYTSNPHNRY